MSEAARTPEPDLSEAVPIAEGTYWVGFEDPGGSLRCNAYLLVDGTSAVLFDPGSVPHFPVVGRKVLSLVDPTQIEAVVLSHQDPDLCGALPVLEDLIGRDDLIIAAHSRMSVLIRYYGLRRPLYDVDRNGWELHLRSGRRLLFGFAPYLHSPGAIMTYDPVTRVLFSGDLGGTIVAGGPLFAGDEYPPEALEFHHAYMPPGDTLRVLLDRLGRLDIQVWAPQHGRVIAGPQRIAQLMAALRGVETGRAAEDAGRFPALEV